jgi:general secretion pathway protein E
MHTRSPFDALYRLRQWGGDPALIASNLLGISLQVLVPKLCPHCKIPATLSAEEQAAVRKYGAADIMQQATFYQAVGCEQCHATGYAGRDVVLEFFEFTPETREAFLQGSPQAALEQIAYAGGQRPLAASGMQKAAEGITSLDVIIKHTVR